MSQTITPASAPAIDDIEAGEKALQRTPGTRPSSINPITVGGKARLKPIYCRRGARRAPPNDTIMDKATRVGATMKAYQRSSNPSSIDK